MIPVKVRGNPLVPIQSRKEAPLNIFIKQNIVVSSAVCSLNLILTFPGNKSSFLEEQPRNVSSNASNAINNFF